MNPPDNRSRLRRTLLYTPGSDEHKCRKALASAADGVIFDLEDAVSPDMKEAARETVCRLLDEPRPAGKEVLVRINQVSSATGIADILAVARHRPDTLIVPKACLRDVTTADVLLAAVEAEAGSPPEAIGMIPLIETAIGVQTVEAVLAAAKRITGVQLGAEDLTRELGIARTRQGKEIAYPRNRLVIAARAAGVDAVDTPYADYRDADGLADDLAYAKSIGMSSKTAIHPCQLEAINSAFTPTEAEVRDAEAIIAAFESAIHAGLGACSLDGRMIDAPIALRAQDVVRRATSARGRQEE